MLAQLILSIPGFLIAMTFHEVAHGAVANMLGDPTAKKLGRLTLNPLKHLDRAGTIVFFISVIVFKMGFGWAKPVPVDGRYFTHPRRDMALVSLAGPATNFAIAAFLGLFIKYGLIGDQVIEVVVYLAVIINIVIGVLNLIPIPPLDGSRLVSALLPVNMLRVYEQFEGYGIAVMFAAIFFFPGILSSIMTPFIDFFTQLFLV